ncbi:hypothetical protein ACGFNU_21035 [Spirillospora sp. NPDC048911]|uniref:hypothetical protein n=1 Tax=Spirillospora sp. NPDC048911 TaxID=3364527 RepID=UPI0037160927
MAETTIITVQTRPKNGEVKALFDQCRRHLGAGPGHRWSEGPSRHYMPGASEYAMEPNQGLPVWLKIFHKPGGVLPPLEDHGYRYVEIWLTNGTRRSHDKLLKQIKTWMNKHRWVWQCQTADGNWQGGR